MATTTTTSSLDRHSDRPMPNPEGSDEWTNANLHNMNIQNSQRDNRSATPVTTASTAVTSTPFHPMEEGAGNNEVNSDEDDTFTSDGGTDYHDIIFLPNAQDDIDQGNHGVNRNFTANDNNPTNDNIRPVGNGTVETNDLSSSEFISSDDEDNVPDDNFDESGFDLAFVKNSKAGASGDHDDEEGLDEETPLNPGDANNNEARSGGSNEGNDQRQPTGGRRNPAFLLLGCWFMILSLVFSVLAIVYRDAGKNSDNGQTSFRIVTPPPGNNNISSLEGTSECAALCAGLGCCYTPGVDCEQIYLFENTVTRCEDYQACSGLLQNFTAATWVATINVGLAASSCAKESSMAECYIHCVTADCCKPERQPKCDTEAAGINCADVALACGPAMKLPDPSLVQEICNGSSSNNNNNFAACAAVCHVVSCCHRTDLDLCSLAFPNETVNCQDYTTCQNQWLTLPDPREVERACGAYL